MRRFIFRHTTADFRKWCHEYVGLAFSIVQTYERWPELFQKEEYEEAKKICRQYKVLLVSLNNYEREMLESKIVKKQVIHYSVREEWMAFLNIYHNWQEICFPKKNITVKTITKQEIGERIKAIRLQHGYTRALVADVIGISEATLKAYENGDRLLRLDVAYQLAQIYGTTVDKLIIFSEKV